MNKRASKGIRKLADKIKVSSMSFRQKVSRCKAMWNATPRPHRNSSTIANDEKAASKITASCRAELEQAEKAAARRRKAK